MPRTVFLGQSSVQSITNCVIARRWQDALTIAPALARVLLGNAFAGLEVQAKTAVQLFARTIAMRTSFWGTARHIQLRLLAGVRIEVH